MNKNIIEATEYLKSFEEGDNITITCDFVNVAELLSEYIKLEETKIGMEDFTGMSWAEMMGEE